MTEEKTVSTPSSVVVPSWLPPLVLLIVFVGLAWWSWRKWADVFIDFGMELYIPWQITQGKALFTDIAWKHGPFSQYFNALWFKVFGSSLTTLIMVNLLILAGFVGLIYRSFVEMCDRLTAFVVSLVFLCLFGFSQYTLTGNYNYICPYLHEQIHGLYFSVAMIYCLGRVCLSAHPGWAFLAGVCLGGVMLTKIELTLGAGATAGFGLGLWWLVNRQPLKVRFSTVGLFFSGMVAVLITGFLFLWTQMPLVEACKGLCGNWLYIGGSDIAGDGFYQLVSGMNQPVQNATRMLWLATAFGSILGLFLFANALSLRFPKHQLWFALSTGILVSLLALIPGFFAWQEAARILPVTSILLWGALSWQSWHHRQDSEQFQHWLQPGMWAVLSLVLLTKMILFVRVGHYGFVLAVPATLMLVASGTYWIPNYLAVHKGTGAVFRAAFLGLMLAGCIFHLNWANDFYSHKTEAFGSGKDLIYAFPPNIDPMGKLLTLAIQDLEVHLPDGATLLVLPHGVSLNYVLRHPNPTPYISYQYFDIKTYGGEPAALRQIQAHTPDFIVLVHNGAGDFISATEESYFGQHPKFGKLTLDWVRQNYVEVRRFGAEPFRSNRVGLSIHQHIPSFATPETSPLIPDQTPPTKPN